MLRFDEVTEKGREVIVPGGSTAGLLYVHIPFCESLCPYCSFHRYVYDRDTANLYFDALASEIELYRRLGYSFTAMYIGGGTPTIAMDRLIELIGRARSLYPLQEISVETNPNHLQEPLLSRLRSAGVNRLSVGVQSFNDDLLKILGRNEKYGDSSTLQYQIRQALGVFETLNIDLIFNLPLQTMSHLMRDIHVVQSLMPDQVTFYPLMAPPSVTDTLQRLFGPVDYRTEKRFYFTILHHMEGLYSGSSAWCFSRHPSMIDEYIVTHDRYIGAGSGAFGCHGDCITINTFSLEQYRQILSQGMLPITKIKRFAARETLYYSFLMRFFGLSLTRAELQRLRACYGKTALAAEILALRLLGAVRKTGTGFSLTDRGKYYWVMAMREFFIAVDTLRDVCRAEVR